MSQNTCISRCVLILLLIFMFNVSNISSISQVPQFIINFQQNDQRGDETREYPSNSIFSGEGFFDIILFAVSSNSTHICFETTLDNFDTNPWDGLHGFSLPIVSIYIDTEKENGEINSVHGANILIEENHAWEWAVTVDGWSSSLFSYTDINNQISNPPISIQSNPTDHKIIIQLPTSIIGAYTDQWVFFVVVGITDSFVFREIKTSAEEWKGGGGDDGDVDPNIYDFLVPFNSNETWLQDHIMNSWAIWGEGTTARKSTLLAVGSEVNYFSDLSYLPTRGVDISDLPEIEDNGGKYYDNGLEQDLFSILKNYGVNSIRLRLWHTPSGNYSNLEKILMMATRIKSAGMNFLLDFHYSDWWADPGSQIKPAEWQNLSFTELNDAMYHYTYDAISAFQDQNTLPDMVQIGNEITPGMLWDDGRVGGVFDNSSQWLNLVELINSGIDGVYDAVPVDKTVKIMIHHAGGSENGGSRWFFDNLIARNLSFDIIGLSYYPWFSNGSIGDVRSNLIDLSLRYTQDIILVETAYPWTLNWTDSTTNRVGLENQLLNGYPASVRGQTDYLQDLMMIIKDIPYSKGLGLFYWEPATLSTETKGSTRENLALFDFEGNSIASLLAFSIPIIKSTTTSVQSSFPTTTDSSYSKATIGISIFPFIYNSILLVLLSRKFGFKRDKKK